MRSSIAAGILTVAIATSGSAADTTATDTVSTAPVVVVAGPETGGSASPQNAREGICKHFPIFC